MRKFNPLPLGVLKGNGRSVCTDIMFKDMAKGNYELTRRGKKKQNPPNAPCLGEQMTLPWHTLHMHIIFANHAICGLDCSAA